MLVFKKCLYFLDTAMNKSCSCLQIYSFSDISQITRQLIYSKIDYNGSKVSDLVDFLNNWISVLGSNKILPVG